MFVLTGVTDGSKKTKYRDKIKDFLDRAEKLKDHIEQEKEGISRESRIMLL